MSCEQPCFSDAQGCITCPSVPARAAKVAYDLRQGWNAGANSVKEIQGSAELIYPVKHTVMNVVIGFKRSRLLQTAPEAVEFGWRVFQSPGVPWMACVAVEYGQAVGGAASCPRGTELAIQRHRGRVTFLINGVPVRVSEHLYFGTVLANVCLFSAGDTLP